jgi:hypothetical protein
MDLYLPENLSRFETIIPEQSTFPIKKFENNVDDFHAGKP